MLKLMGKKRFTRFCLSKPLPTLISRASPGPEVIKLEYTIKLKIKRNDWLLAEAAIYLLYFETETVLKFFIT